MILAIFTGGVADRSSNGGDLNNKCGGSGLEAEAEAEAAET